MKAERNGRTLSHFKGNRSTVAEDTNEQSHSQCGLRKTATATLLQEFLKYCINCVGCVCMSMQYLWSPEEVGFVGVRGGCELPNECWEQNSFSATALRALNC